MSTDLCEHGEIEVACLDCFGKPKKLAAQGKVTKRTTKTPTSANDSIAPLSGALDVSIPVDDPAEIVGAEQVPARIFPHHLRRGGWVYLRNEDALAGRVKAKKMVWDDDVNEMALLVDPSTWDESVTIPLGDLAIQQRNGYRYLASHDDGTVTHYKGGKPVQLKDPDEHLDDA